MNNSSECTPANTFVLTDPSEASRWVSSKWETTLYLTFVLTVFTTSCISNFGFFFMLARVPRMQTVVNLYLANLAVADIVYSFVTTLYYAVNLLKSRLVESAPFSFPYTCILLYVPAFFSYYASMLLISVVSFDRFLAICFPLRRRYIDAKVLAKKILTATWLLALIPTTVSLLRWSKQVDVCIKWPETDLYRNMPQRATFCTEVFGRDVRIVAMCSFLLLFFACLVANMIMYGGMIMALNPKRRAGTSSGTNSSQTLVRNQVARMLVITGIVYFLCHLPIRCYTINELVTISGGTPLLSKRQHQMILTIGRILLILAASTNSFIYCVTSEHYRRGFKEAFSRRRSAANNSSNNQKLNTVSGRALAGSNK